MLHIQARVTERRNVTENRGPAMQIVIWVFYAIAVVFCMVRFYSRGVILKAFGTDDYMMMVTLVFSTCVTLTVPMLVKSGAGVHQWELQKDQILNIFKMAWISQVFYLPTLWALKLSILGLYARITTDPKHRKILLIFALILTAHTIAITVINFVLCKPQKVTWDAEGFSREYLRILQINYFNAAFYITTDLVLVVLPIPILAGLHISRRKKIGVIVIFSLGLMAVGLTIARVAFVVTWGNTPTDFSWTWMPVALTSSLEINVAMIMACLPALNVLMKRAFNLSSTIGENSKDFELERASHGLSNNPELQNSSKGRIRSLGYNSAVFSTKAPENESEENIMDQVSRDRERERRERTESDFAQMGSGQVVKTVDFTVTRDDASLV
ncbi:hypothetical protein FN846DRAFT_960950 [Sphaerosporella brunnea]|uniref:Rhodopsin domain-containing protein n=1 Tax=Sphaerosporella brunnea TaxID=1250544 RepID=A0A5J5EQD6_9PEZI|nr:hypothetical protein FN846DRAFT_960950 [Sphaerosporella brunnea]